MEVNHTLKDILGESLKRNSASAFCDLLLTFCVPSLYFREQILMEEGADEHFLALIVRGTVDVLVGSQVVHAARAPTWFGEMAMLGLSDKRTASVKARSFCEVWLL